MKRLKRLWVIGQTSVFNQQRFLTPTQQLREQEVLNCFFSLMETERSRYESQANDLLATGKLQKQTPNLDLNYWLKEGSFFYEAKERNGRKESIQGEMSIPDAHDAQIETLIELFAHSESGIIS